MTEAAAVPAVDLPGGVRMPMIGFGTWLLRGRAGRDAMRAALGAGYRHIDTATMYGNEADVGHVLASSGLARDEVFVTGTMGGLTPVTAIDGRTVGDGSPGPVTGRLTGLFADLTARSGTPVV